MAGPVGAAHHRHHRRVPLLCTLAPIRQLLAFTSDPEYDYDSFLLVFQSYVRNYYQRCREFRRVAQQLQRQDQQEAAGRQQKVEGLVAQPSWFHMPA